MSKLSNRRSYLQEMVQEEVEVVLLVVAELLFKNRLDECVVSS